MKKPLIGLNPYHFEQGDAMWNGSKDRYFAAIWAAGGMPVTLHYPNQDDSINEIAQTIDGLLLVGGPDIPNDIYNGNHPELMDSDVMGQERENFDRKIFLAMYDLRKPMLAICVGMQHINVIRGGTLYEDLNVQLDGSVNHGEFNGDYAQHTVKLEKNSLINKVINSDNPEIISTHHQGIRNLGSGLKPVSWSDDGLIEAIEDTQIPDSFLAVQWHPEFMLDDDDQIKLFKWLVLESLSKSQSTSP
jgi:putative glutamine amidotransferase